MLSALVLTAGLGTRLDPMTRLVAKAAVPLTERTLVEQVLVGLAGQGVTQVVLNLHHHPESIAAVVGDGSHLGVSARYSWEFPLLGSAGGPRHALPLMSTDPFLIVNGDTLSHVDLSALVAEHQASGASVTMAVIPNPNPSHYNGIVCDPSGTVTGFVPKGQADGSWHFVGVQVVSRSVFASLADGDVVETVAGIYRDLIVNVPGSVRIVPVTGPFLDIGTAGDYLDTCLALRRGAPGLDQLAGPAGASLIDSVCWPTARIDAGAVLERCVVAGDATVPAGFEAREAVIVPARVVHDEEPNVRLVGDVALFPLAGAARRG